MHTPPCLEDRPPQDSRDGFNPLRITLALAAGAALGAGGVLLAQRLLAREKAAVGRAWGLPDGVYGQKRLLTEVLRAAHHSLGNAQDLMLYVKAYDALLRAGMPWGQV